jgi:D-sedoheptulose 7-phosphate isomerase
MNSLLSSGVALKEPLGEYVFCGEHKLFSNYAEKLGDVLSQLDLSAILKLSQIIMDLRKKKGRVFICGNGGSAANAAHIVNDLVYAVAECTGLGVDAIALGSNPAVITCLGNDVGYDNIYSEQLAVAGRNGDVLIVLSGSGNSQNIVNAIETAKRIGIQTVALLGFDGGKCLRLVDLAIHFKIDDMQVAEDLQLIVGHMVMRWLKKEIINKGCSS